MPVLRYCIAHMYGAISDDLAGASRFNAYRVRKSTESRSKLEFQAITFPVDQVSNIVERIMSRSQMLMRKPVTLSFYHQTKTCSKLEGAVCRHSVASMPNIAQRDLMTIEPSTCCIETRLGN